MDSWCVYISQVVTRVLHLVTPLLQHNLKPHVYADFVFLSNTHGLCLFVPLESLDLAEWRKGRGCHSRLEAGRRTTHALLIEVVTTPANRCELLPTAASLNCDAPLSSACTASQAISHTAARRRSNKPR